MPHHQFLQKDCLKIHSLSHNHLFLLLFFLCVQCPSLNHREEKIMMKDHMTDDEHEFTENVIFEYKQLFQFIYNMRSQNGGTGKLRKGQ